MVINRLAVNIPSWLSIIRNVSGRKMSEWERATYTEEWEQYEYELNQAQKPKVKAQQPKRKLNMSLVMKEEQGDFELLEPGTYAARCIWVIGMGPQVVNFQGQESVKVQIYIGWEIASETMRDGRPFMVGQTYTASFNKKSKLRINLESWRGRAFTQEELEGFDLAKLAGVPCMVSVIHNESSNGKTYVNLSSIAPLPKGMECPPLVNDTIVFDPENFVQSDYEQLPQWLQDKINVSPKKTESMYGEAEEDLMDDIPF